jgi:predicted component of type VI protein secretion system
MKKNNYKLGAIKRKLGIKGDFEPGALLSKVNESKKIIKKQKQLSKTRLAIMGLV